MWMVAGCVMSSLPSTRTNASSWSAEGLRDASRRRARANLCCREEPRNPAMTLALLGPFSFGTTHGSARLDRLRRRFLHHHRLRAAGAAGMADALDQGHLAQDVPRARHGSLPVAGLRLLEG